MCYLLVDFLWIPHDLGGHRTPPYDGMRPNIRWQCYPKSMHGISCQIMEFDPADLRGKACCHMPFAKKIPANRFQEGQLFELLDGPRVIAVGKISKPPGKIGAPYDCTKNLAENILGAFIQWAERQHFPGKVVLKNRGDPENRVVILEVDTEKLITQIIYWNNCRYDAEILHVESEKSVYCRHGVCHPDYFASEFSGFLEILGNNGAGLSGPSLRSGVKKFDFFKIFRRSDAPNRWIAATPLKPESFSKK